MAGVSVDSNGRKRKEVGRVKDGRTPNMKPSTSFDTHLHTALTTFLSRLDTHQPDPASFDESLIGLLTYIGSLFAQRGFAELQDVRTTQRDLWTQFYCPVVKRYQFITELNKNTKDFEDTKQRLVQICQTISYYYKNLITRIVEMFGDELDLTCVVSSLKLWPEPASFPSQPENVLQILKLTVHDSLCRMGDLSRHRTLDKTDSFSHSTSAADLYHALIYHTTATRLCPESSAALIMLSKVSRLLGDHFSEVYHCLRAAAVRQRVSEKRLRVVLREAQIDGKGAERNLLEIVEVYSGVYLRCAGEGEKLAQGNEFIQRQELQKLHQLTNKLLTYCRTQQVPGRSLVQLVIVCAIFTWLHGSVDGPSPFLEATAMVYTKIVSAAVECCGRGSCERYTFGKPSKLPAEVSQLLPAVRVIMEWLRHWSCNRQGLDELVSQCRKLVRFLCMVYGFGPSGSEQASKPNETIPKEPTDIYEETQTLGLLPFGMGLLVAEPGPEGKSRAQQNVYRVRCIAELAARLVGFGNADETNGSIGCGDPAKQIHIPLSEMAINQESTLH